MLERLDSAYAMSQEDIAAELGITRSRVSQLERSALKKIGKRMGPFLAVLNGPLDRSWEWKYDRLYREKAEVKA